MEESFPWQKQGPLSLTHATTKWQDRNKSAWEGMWTDRVSDRRKAEPQTYFSKTKEKATGNKMLSLTCYIAGLKRKICKQGLETDLYQLCISIEGSF